MDHNNQSCELLEKVQPHEQADVVHSDPILDLVCSSGCREHQASWYTRFGSSKFQLYENQHRSCF